MITSKSRPLLRSAALGATLMAGCTGPSVSAPTAASEVPIPREAPPPETPEVQPTPPAGPRVAVSGRVEFLGVPAVERATLSIVGPEGYSAMLTHDGPWPWDFSAEDTTPYANGLASGRLTLNLRIETKNGVFEASEEVPAGRVGVVLRPKLAVQAGALVAPTDAPPAPERPVYGNTKGSHRMERPAPPKSPKE